MHFNLGFGGEAKPHSSCVMTTVASTLGPVEQTTGWWAINLLDQNDEATAPHISKKVCGRQSSLTKHFSGIRLCNCQCPSSVSSSCALYVLWYWYTSSQSLCFSAWSCICPVIYLTHCNVSEQCTSNHKLQYYCGLFQKMLLCLSFPTHGSKGLLTKKPTALKWSSLTLVTLKWFFSERNSLIFVPPQAPRSTVMC